MQKLSLLFIGIIFSWVACTNPASNDQENPKKQSNSLLSPMQDSLYEMVMYKHDEVMPKTADIARLNSKLKTYLEQDTTHKDTIMTLLARLDQADEGMMQWMREIKSVEGHKSYYETSSEAEITEYLKSEEERIDEVAQQMLTSIEQARTWLAANKLSEKQE